jgi:hypothetical protein
VRVRHAYFSGPGSIDIRARGIWTDFPKANFAYSFKKLRNLRNFQQEDDMARRSKVYLTRSEYAGDLRMSCGPRREDLFKLAQERDWKAYLASLEPIKPFPKRVTNNDLQRLADHFKG